MAALALCLLLSSPALISAQQPEPPGGSPLRTALRAKVDEASAPDVIAAPAGAFAIETNLETFATAAPAAAVTASPDAAASTEAPAVAATDSNSTAASSSAGKGLLSLNTPLMMSFDNWVQYWLGLLVINLGFGLLFYERGVLRSAHNKPDVKTATQIFKHGHFSCFDAEYHLSLHACCCPWLRWADTMSMASIGRFWAAFVLIGVAAFLGYYCSFSIALLLLYYRQKFRERLASAGMIDVQAWTLQSCCMDWWFALCCPCCLLVQEARVASELCMVGHPHAVKSDHHSHSLFHR